MSFFPKNRVRLISRTKVGVDKLNQPIWEDTSQIITGAMVTPEGSSDKDDQHDLWDDTFVILHLPKAFTGSVKNTTFEPLNGPFAGRLFKVQGDPGAMERAVLQWNRGVRAKEVFR